MKRITLLSIVGCIFSAAAVLAPQVAKAATYTAKAGAETPDESVQANVFSQMNFDLRGRQYHLDIRSEERDPFGYLPNAAAGRS